MSKERKPYLLPADQMERLTRTEYQNMIFLLHSVSICNYALEEMPKRIECIPNGTARLKMAMGQLRAIVDDLMGTVPDKQVLKIRGTVKDMEIRIVPKMTKRSVGSLLISTDDMRVLVNHAKAECRMCVMDGEEARKCPLQQTLSALLPLENYGDGTLCPYNLADWEVD